jgi:hypothetical protein
VAKLWFWLNDWAGCWLGNHLVAVHPEIKKHLATRVGYNTAVFCALYRLKGLRDVIKGSVPAQKITFHPREPDVVLSEDELADMLRTD